MAKFIEVKIRPQWAKDNMPTEKAIYINPDYIEEITPQGERCEVILATGQSHQLLHTAEFVLSLINATNSSFS